MRFKKTVKRQKATTVDPTFIAILLGISRSKVTNLMRLLTLDARIQHWMKQGELSLSHGKILAGLPDDDQYWFAYEAIKKEWSVSMLDDSIKIITEKRKTSGKLTSRQTQKSSVLTNPLEKKVSSQFGHSIKVILNKNDSGSFHIPFQNKEAMRAILKKLGCGDKASV